MADFTIFLNKLTAVSAESSKRFSELFTPQVLKKGDYYVKEGQIVNKIGFLENGVMRSFYRKNNGYEYNKSIYAKPCFIGGYTALITQEPSQLGQEALTDCNILVANYASIIELYHTCPDLERAARILSEFFFVGQERREIELALLDADQRYLNFQKEFPTLESIIPQYHIASYLGISPTQLSRIRRKICGK